MTKKLTTEEFVNRAIAKHGEKYDYSRVEYKGSRVPITIVCPDHGPFEQIPANHLFKHGCVKCAGVEKKSHKDFIKEANKKHKNKYDYSGTEYKNARSKIKIICPDHGPFFMTANNHLNGHGCSICNGGVSKSHQDFVGKASILHDGKYVYNDQYIRSAQKIAITCPDHGEFLQTPNDHITGYGCPKCTHVVSKPSQEWLNSIGLPNDEYHREVGGLIPNTRYTVDGYEPSTNTVYEFHGDYWHGNPKLYDANDVNPSNGKTYGELYEKTLLKRKAYEDRGFRYIEMWHSDYIKLINH